MLRFNANLFRLAFTCSSNEETRYYLRGVFVEPHAQGGVTLTATDGHRLICIRDENGQADESAIVNLGDALKQCKAKSGFVRVVSIGTGETDATIYEAREPAGEMDFQRIAIAPGVRVDGSFPDYRRVVPQSFSDKGAPGFAGRYLASFGTVADELASHMGLKAGKHSADCYSPVRVLCEDGKRPEGSPALILFPRCEYAFGILMPVRIEAASLSVPSWFRAVAAPMAQAAE